MTEWTPEETEMNERYLGALHAMQSGVAVMLNYNNEDVTSKHLRVGINSALVEGSAIARLLIDKGIISVLEYMTALAEGMEAEVKVYEKRISDFLADGKSDGPNIVLR